MASGNVNPFGTKGPTKGKSTTTVIPKFIAKPTASATKSSGALPKGGGKAATGSKLIQSSGKTGSNKTGTQPKVGPITGPSNTFIPGYTPGGTDTGGDTGGDTTGFPAAGTFAGYELSGDRKQRRPRFHDGKGGFTYGAFETNPDYKPEEDTKTKTPNVAYDTIQKILESYRITGIASVLESIRDEYPEANSEDILTLLQFDSRYNTKFNERFSANVDRLKAGKPVLSPGEYLQLEQGYSKVLSSYNLPTFNNQKYYDSFIKSDLDVVEVTDRIQLGYDRVLSDDPVNRAFKQFFPSLGLGDIVAGMLDPVNQLPALQQKVKAAEIGGAALRQGFKADEISLGATGSTLGADILAKQGITKTEAEAGYGKIAGLLPTAEKLSSIYSTTEQKYGRLEAEEEEFQGLASAERKRKRLSSLETAQFQGSAGVGESGISTQNLRRSSSAGQY